MLHDHSRCVTDPCLRAAQDFKEAARLSAEAKALTAKAAADAAAGGGRAGRLADLQQQEQAQLAEAASAAEAAAAARKTVCSCACCVLMLPRHSASLQMDGKVQQIVGCSMLHSTGDRSWAVFCRQHVRGGAGRTPQPQPLCSSWTLRRRPSSLRRPPPSRSLG